MAKTQIVYSLFVPTTAMARVTDLISELNKVADGHKAHNLFVQILGPYPDDFERVENGQSSSSSANGGSAVGRSPADGGPAGSPADGERPKRGPGRPRKSEAGQGTTEGQRDERRDGERDRSAPEGSGGNELQRAREEPRQSRDEGSERHVGSGRSGSSGGGSEQASRVNEPDDWSDDWGSGPDNTGDITAAEAVNLPGNEWPDHLTPETVDKTELNTILGDHYRATGGKDKALTFAVMEEATGTPSLAKVHPDDYRKLAKALLKDIARYENGMKKPK